LFHAETLSLPAQIESTTYQIGKSADVVAIFAGSAEEIGDILRDHHADQFVVSEFPSPGVDSRVFTDYWQELQSEDRMGCARGIVWAIIFEAALVVVAMAWWKLHVWPL
jgi:hypothetical protein